MKCIIYVLCLCVCVCVCVQMCVCVCVCAHTCVYTEATGAPTRSMGCCAFLLSLTAVITLFAVVIVGIIGSCDCWRIVFVAEICVYKGQYYAEGQQWYDGCDKRCVCDDGATNYYRCSDR